MQKIIPAVLAANLEEFNDKLSKIVLFADEIQIDIIDGAFINNKTVELIDISSLPADKNYQAHLMVTDPVDYLFHCKRLGIKTIIFHNEIEKDTSEIIEKIREQNFNVFLAIAPESELESFEKYIPLIDGILLMSVSPGFSGQQLIEKVLEKASILRKKYPNLIIEMDGGINKNNLKIIFDSGVNIAVVGAGILKAEDPKKEWEELEKIKEQI